MTHTERTGGGSHAQGPPPASHTERTSSRTADGGAAHTPHPTAREEKSEWAEGGALFAGVLMLVYGLFGVVQGVAAISSGDVYTAVGDYAFRFNLTAWGWIHLVVGVVLAFIGWGILKGADWARGAGVGLAVLGIVLNFMWLPYQPLWALVSIAIGGWVTWALCADRARPVV